MKSQKWLTGMLGVWAALGLGLGAQAATVTFDDLEVKANVLPIDDEYHDLVWENMWVGNIAHWYGVRGSGHERGTVSGVQHAYNPSGNPASVSGPVFNFTGAYLTAGWTHTLWVRVEGLLGDVVLYDETVELNNAGPLWCEFNYRGIDRVRFTSVSSYPPNQPGSLMVFVLDDFTYSEAVVPVPAASGLVLVGMGGMALRRRFRRT